MAATGISLESGMTNTTFLEAEIKRGGYSSMRRYDLVLKLYNLSHFLLPKPHRIYYRPATETFCNSSLKTIFVFVTTTEFILGCTRPPVFGRRAAVFCQFHEIADIFNSMLKPLFPKWVPRLAAANGGTLNP